MSDIITVIGSLKGLVSLQGASKDAVTAAEQSLGLSFAADYRTYLEKYGLISARHIEITGLAEPKRLNVVSVTLAERQKNQLPQDMYVVEDSGIEGVLILQNGIGEMYEFQNRQTKKIYNSLADYLRSK
jgi:hypothetical protein